MKRTIYILGHYLELEDDLQDGIMLYLEEHGIDSNFAEVTECNSGKRARRVHSFLDKLESFVED